MAAAKAPGPQPGVLLDYILINSTQTNLRLMAQLPITQLITSPFLRPRTLEGGAVAKGIQWDGGVATGTFIVLWRIRLPHQSVSARDFHSR